jgi:flagellar export protein FliJ
MADYKFRLETLKKLRESRRDEQRVSLADAFRAEQILADRCAELDAEQDKLRELQRSAGAGRYLNVNRLIEAQRYELVLKVRQQELTRQQSLLATETERRRLTLVEADRDVRALELLDERQRDDFTRKQRRAEQKQLDEAALQQHGRWPSRHA